MRLTVAGFVLLSVLIGFQGVSRADHSCNLSMAKPWSTRLNGYGIDYGEEGMGEGFYTRQPDHDLALSDANKDYALELKTCKNLCSIEKGRFFLTGGLAQNCHFESTYPKFWECVLSAPVSCQ